MKTTIKLSIITMAALAMMLLCSCSSITSDIQKSIDERDADSLIACINTALEEDKNVDEMNQLIDEEFNELTGTTEYDDFVFVETVRDGIEDSKTKDNIDAILDDNAKNKVMSFLNGTWIRKDGTDMDGAYGDVSWSEGTGVLILSNVSDAINPEKFNESDLKWNNVTVIDANTIKGDDLMKSEGVGEYKAFTGAIDYENNMVSVQTVDDSTNYASGNNQTWILKEYYDSFEGKQLLNDDDFKVTGDGINEDFIINELKGNSIFYYFFYDPDYDKSEAGVVTTNRGIQLGSTKVDIIEKYGMGSYAKYDKDADIIRFSDGDVPPSVAKAKYSLQYREKDKKGRRLFFYLDENDKVVTVFYGAHDYATMLKDCE